MLNSSGEISNFFQKPRLAGTVAPKPDFYCFRSSRHQYQLKSSSIKPFVAAFSLFAMAVRIHDQQNKKNQPADHKHDGDGLIPPNFGQKVRRVHPFLIYIQSG
jgi:hypothetical protein